MAATMLQNLAIRPSLEIMPQVKIGLQVSNINIEVFVVHHRLVLIPMMGIYLKQL